MKAFYIWSKINKIALAMSIEDDFQKRWDMQEHITYLSSTLEMKCFKSERIIKNLREEL